MVKLKFSRAYFDLKEALSIEPENEKANRMITDLRESADRFRNSGVILGLNNRLPDGIMKLTQAIEYVSFILKK